MGTYRKWVPSPTPPTWHEGLKKPNLPASTDKSDFMFSPQHFVFGSPFLLSLSAYTRNGGTHDFYPPLSTGPITIIIIIFIVVPPQPVTFPWVCEKSTISLGFPKKICFVRN